MKILSREAARVVRRRAARDPRVVHGVLVLPARGYMGALLPNARPTVEITQWPAESGSPSAYAFEFSWSASDADGAVTGFRWTVDPPRAAASETLWTATSENRRFFRSPWTARAQAPSRTACTARGRGRWTTAAPGRRRVRDVRRDHDRADGRDLRPAALGARLAARRADRADPLGRARRRRCRLEAAVEGKVPQCSRRARALGRRHRHRTPTRWARSSPRRSRAGTRCPASRPRSRSRDLTPRQLRVRDRRVRHRRRDVARVLALRNVLDLYIDTNASIGPQLTLFNDAFYYRYPSGGWFSGSLRFPAGVPGRSPVAISWSAVNSSGTFVGGLPVGGGPPARSRTARRAARTNSPISRWSQTTLATNVQRPPFEARVIGVSAAALLISKATDDIGYQALAVIRVPLPASPRSSATCSS